MSALDIRAWMDRLGLTLEQAGAALSGPGYPAVNGNTLWRWMQPPDSPHHRQAPPYLWRAMRDVEREHEGPAS
ncbi:MAG: hypothetical protein ACRDGH_13355 [Candidatus Limnocylindria bacterium]